MLFERAFPCKWNGARGGRPLQAAARAYIRFMFHAIVTRLHSLGPGQGHAGGTDGSPSPIDDAEHRFRNLLAQGIELLAFGRL